MDEYSSPRPAIIRSAIIAVILSLALYVFGVNGLRVSIEMAVVFFLIGVGGDYLRHKARWKRRSGQP